MDDKKIVFSGIQPTGIITIGNYIGAIGNWLEMQETHNCLFCVVDMHSITVLQNPTELRQRSMSFMAQYLACGLDPEKNIMYFQSHVSEHAELAWVLNCSTYIGELNRMTQFKEKSRKNADNLNMGLMDYPVLMAADILLYKTDLVPVGVDQKQHVELARDIAIRFNSRFGDTFTVPEPFIPKSGAKIFSLADPTQKMSKSDSNENASVSIIDEPDVIMRKFKRAVTDSGNSIVFSPEKPGISNLLTIYSKMADTTVESAEREFEGLGYGDFKLRVGEAVCEKLRPVREEYKRIIADKAYLTEVAKNGALQAKNIARRTLSKVHRKVGFVNREF